MEYVIDAQGLLSQPHLCDGAVQGLRLVDKTTLEISVATEKGEPYTLLLTGLQRLRCDGFAEVNTIHAAEIIRNAQPRLEILYRLTGEPPAKEPYRSRHQDWMDELSRSIIDGHLTLVSLEPFYGCTITALCEGVRIDGGA